MITIEKAKQLRALIEKAAIKLDDTDALSGVELFPVWSNTASYSVGDRVTYEGILYKCLTKHTAQDTWIPIDAPSLWTKVLIPDSEEIPEWEQPESTNPYMKGDKVTHNGTVWVSDIDTNTWEPGVYGWTQVTE